MTLTVNTVFSLPGHHSAVNYIFKKYKKMGKKDNWQWNTDSIWCPKNNATQGRWVRKSV